MQDDLLFNPSMNLLTLLWSRFLISDTSSKLPLVSRILLHLFRFVLFRLVFFFKYMRFVFFFKYMRFSISQHMGNFCSIHWCCFEGICGWICWMCFVSSRNLLNIAKHNLHLNRLGQTRLIFPREDLVTQNYFQTTRTAGKNTTITTKTTTTTTRFWKLTKKSSKFLGRSHFLWGARSALPKRKCVSLQDPLT